MFNLRVRDLFASLLPIRVDGSNLLVLSVRRDFKDSTCIDSMTNIEQCPGFILASFSFQRHVVLSTSCESLPRSELYFVYCVYEFKVVLSK